MNWILMLLGAYILSVAIYNITANTVQGALVTNSLLVGIGAVAIYFGYTK